MKRLLAGVAVVLSMAALADNIDPERRAKMMERRAARLAAAGQIRAGREALQH